MRGCGAIKRAAQRSIVGQRVGERAGLVRVVGGTARLTLAVWQVQSFNMLEFERKRSIFP